MLNGPGARGKHSTQSEVVISPIRPKPPKQRRLRVSARCDTERRRHAGAPARYIGRDGKGRSSPVQSTAPTPTNAGPCTLP
ncbi:hypothetical protein HYQ44_014404 [Verticillium longisporum]|nr:hypothetical protein HYQ44_014404 [Verticillium longisporum]